MNLSASKRLSIQMEGDTKLYRNENLRLSLSSREKGIILSPVFMNWTVKWIFDPICPSCPCSVRILSSGIRKTFPLTDLIDCGRENSECVIRTVSKISVALTKNLNECPNHPNLYPIVSDYKVQLPNSFASLTNYYCPQIFILRLNTPSELPI